MIARLWYGWTTPEDADEYERLLREKIVPGFAEEGIDGYRGFRVGRRPREDDVEFVTVMRFSSWDAVKEFAGEDYEEAHVPPEAREVLTRFDDRARHYEVAVDVTDGESP
ncbi:antibiotic biosynthesis monooxygenase [halophilic archaeon]|nr:antibiotic biosynthesis monooxygenase [halophilic archaeon]